MQIFFLFGRPTPLEDFHGQRSSIAGNKITKTNQSNFDILLPRRTLLFWFGLVSVCRLEGLT